MITAIALHATRPQLFSTARRRMCTSNQSGSSAKASPHASAPLIPPPPPPEPGSGRVLFVARVAATSLAVFIGYRQFTGAADLLDPEPPAIMPPPPGTTASAQSSD